MTDQEKETAELIENIISKALEGNAQEFQSILYWSDFRYYRKCATANKLLIKALKHSANKLFKEYCRTVIAGISDVTKLLAYLQLLDVVDFYVEELRTIQAMLDDYDMYLGDPSNFFNAILGGEREL